MKFTKKERSKLAAKGWSDPVWFCEFFLKKWFPTPLKWFQKAILALLLRRCDFLEDDPDLDRIIKNFVWYEEDDSKKENPIPIFWLDDDGHIHMDVNPDLLILIPRGFSKTTLVNSACVYSVSYQLKKFPFFVSKTGTHAKKQLAAVGKQFKSNKRIKAVFGEIASTQRGEDSGKWSESAGILQTKTGIVIQACGRGGQTRGMLDDGARPDWLVIDDLEDKESIKTPERRKDTREWVFSDLLPFVDELNPEVSKTMLGNLIDADCAAVNIKSDPSWTTIILGALDIDGEPIWPELWDKEKLEKKKTSYALLGLLHLYYMEYFNEVRSPEDANFKPEYITIIPRLLTDCPIKALALDPAISKKAGADFVSLCVIGMSEKGFWHVYESYSRKGMSTNEQIEKYFQFYKTYQPNVAGVESNAFQIALIGMMTEYMFRSRDLTLMHTPVPIQHNSDESKHQRILGALQPRYSAGFITHQMKFPELETQLLDFPNGKKDAPDAEAMAIKLLDSFTGFVADGSNEEDSLPPLEEVYGGNWRKY